MAQSRQVQLNNDIDRLTRNGSDEQQEAAQELVDAIGTSHDVLLRIKTLFPFTLFPTTVSVDRTKISITERDFFRTGEVLSIRIEDLLNVTVNVGPILGSVKIST